MIVVGPPEGAAGTRVWFRMQKKGESNRSYPHLLRVDVT